MMRLAQLEARLGELKNAERDTLAALELERIDPATLLRRLRLLTRSRSETEAAYRDELSRAQELGRRAKLTQRVFERADQEWRREEASTELRRQIDRASFRDVSVR